MAFSVAKKKSKLPTKEHPNKLSFFCAFLLKAPSRIPVLVLALVVVYLWSSSTTIFSGNVVHVCVSSRKFNNLYCVSAGTEPNLDVPMLVNNISLVSSLNNTEESKRKEDSVLDRALLSPSPVVINSTNGRTLSDAYKQVEEQLRLHRSWKRDSTDGSCDGKGIYVYDLPSKFNKDLMAQCDQMMTWVDFCKFLSNGALGEPIERLGKGWYHTHQYSLEPIFHARVLRHPCRVYDENMAQIFYVPYYGGLDILRWHFKNVSNEVKDSLGLELLRWLETQKPWYGNLGKDHVFVLGKISWDFRRYEWSSWGTRFLELDEMQNPIKLLIERQPWHTNDIGIPHPTYFHPHTDDDIVSWQLKIIKSQRKNLVSFAGAARPGAPENIRSILIEQCTSSPNGECKLLNCSYRGCDQPESIIELFMESDFCLQPPGDSATRKSVFDSLVSGCIPVLFDPMTAYYQYPWHLPEDYGKYSVFIDKDEVRNRSVNVVKKLMQIPPRQRENMRRYVVYELLPGLVYGDSSSELQNFQDAFSITMNNLFERVKRLNVV